MSTPFFVIDAERWPRMLERLRIASGDDGLVEDDARADLRFLENEHRVYLRTHGSRGAQFPGRPVLSKRWGWPDRRVRKLLEADDWHCPMNPIPARELRRLRDPIDNSDDALFELPGPLTHAEVVQRARAWLLGHHRCRVAFAEIVTSENVNPDAIGFRAGSCPTWSVLVEAKVSRGDFRADREKIIHILPDSCPGQERWYLTPPNLVRPEEVPAGWGLAEVGKRSVRVVLPAPVGEFSAGRAAADMGILIAAVRRHQLGVEWLAESGKFRPYSEAR